MKLFFFRPTEHGPVSYAVMAETEAEAWRAVEQQCASDGIKPDDPWYASPRLYGLEVYERGEVTTNDNS